MKTVRSLLLTVLVLIPMAGQALAAENMILGQVPDRIIVTLKPGVAFPPCRTWPPGSRSRAWNSSMAA